MRKQWPPEVFCQKYSLRNFAKLTEKHLCWSLFFNEVAGLRHETLLKKWLQCSCFPVCFATFLEIYFLQNISGAIVKFETVVVNYTLSKIATIYVAFHYFVRFLHWSCLTNLLLKNNTQKCDKNTSMVNIWLNFWKIPD